MKYTTVLLFLFITSFCFSQDEQWIQTEGEIIEINIHQGKKKRESAIIKFTLENGNEQMGTTELFRIPFIGSLKSVGDKISVNYKKSNPVLLETTFGNFLSKYGMYILVVLGMIFSIKPFIKKAKQ